MSAVDDIREAAALMRSRAEAASPGPWEATALGSEGYAVLGDRAPVSGRRSRLRVARLGWEEWAVDRGNAHHIASWPPAVALAVADWLEAFADLHEASQHRDRPAFGDLEQAHALALTYLGRAS